MERDDLILGIDLGTTNSCMAIVEDGAPQIIPISPNDRTMPSMVAFTPKGRRLVGHLAKRQALVNPKNTIFAAKRLIGRRWSSKERKELEKYLPYKLVEGPQDDIRIEVNGEIYSPTEISSIILAELKRIAEDHLASQLKYAVITVPAYFNDNQRQATKDAGKMAGLEVLRILNEPTAAALAFGLGREEQVKVAVYDLGGGTFDISILELQSGVFEVISTAGDTFLGGEDFDNRVIEWIIHEFAKEHQIDLRDDPLTFQRIKEAAEKARCELSFSEEVEITIPFLYTDQEGRTYHLNKKFPREKLEALTEDLIARTISICELAIQHAELTPRDIDEVLLVGGMTYMPKVREEVANFFNRKVRSDIDPHEAVAMGAALQGETLVKDESNVLLLDVTPHSLGIMIAGGFYQVLIERNTPLPCSKSHIFTTVKDYQTQVRIIVLQGESANAEENEVLGELILDDIPPALRGEVEIEVTFFISADGILSVSAKDLKTNREQSITLKAPSRLSPEELEKMREANIEIALESKMNEEFEKKRELVELELNEINELLPTVEEIISKTKIGDQVMKKAIETIEIAEKAIENEDLESLTAILPKLQKTNQTFSKIVQRGAKRS